MIANETIFTQCYDNLNRLIGKTYDAPGTTNDYADSYVYDLVGNRLSRTVAANGQTLTTEYQYYNDGSDRLFKEIHTGPVAAVPIGDERYYAYANSGGNSIFYKSADGNPISAIKAFILGLPTEWSLYLFALILALAPVSFISPAAAAYLRRSTHTPLKRQAVHLTLWRRCLCVLLAYMMLVTPCGIESAAYASSQYNQIAAANWAAHKYIEYTYDNNGSCITKTTKDSGSSVVEAVQYDYNLQNKLFRITTDPISGSTVSVTEYTYNDEGIRVQAVSYDMPRGGGTHTNETTTIDH